MGVFGTTSCEDLATQEDGLCDHCRVSGCETRYRDEFIEGLTRVVEAVVSETIPAISEQLRQMKTLRAEE